MRKKNPGSPHLHKFNFCICGSVGKRLAVKVGWWASLNWKWVCKGVMSTLLKGGCFKHWMVTLVADKLRRQWLWEIITLAIDPKLYLTTDNLNICEGVTTIIIWHLYKLATHRCSMVTIIICKIMVVIACFLIQAGVTPSSVVKDCTILVVTLPMFL